MTITNASLLATTICQLILCTSVLVKIYYVSPRGSDANSGTSQNEPFQMVQHAIDTMKAGSLDSGG